jgi:hypothetical protein
LHNNKRGAVGSIFEIDSTIADLKKRLETPQPIVCPNQRCGCGMCVPKAENNNEFQIIWNSIVKV